jgi:predicted acetylornithine/succinylornithine family transaminase
MSVKTKEKKDFEIKTVYAENLMPTYAPEILLVKGQGGYVWDILGKRYLDFAAGISVCNLGHCHPKITEAISSQAAKLVHTSNLYMNELQPVLAEKLISNGFDDGMAFFCNSGAEANEGAIKIVRKYGNRNGRFKIIVMENSFHGRTLATLAATGRAKYREGFGPDMPGFSFVPFNDIDALKNAIDSKTAAVMLEPIQGEGGVIPAEQIYLQQVRELCDKNDLLLVFDEVQCGMGRTGYFYAFQGYKVQPDVLTMAKALGNGFPIGAILAKKKYASLLQQGTHASTFGGNPLACAAALATIRVMEEDGILENCRTQSEYLFMRLNQMTSKKILKIRGKGLMVGIVLDDDPRRVVAESAGKGLLILQAGEGVLRLLPPLIVERKDIDNALEIIADVLK